MEMLDWKVELLQIWKRGGGGRLRFLPRYHLENYFLDAEALAAVFEELEPADSWLRSPTAIDSELTAIAAQMSAYAVSLMVLRGASPRRR